MPVSCNRRVPANLLETDRTALIGPDYTPNNAAYTASRLAEWALLDGILGAKAR